MERSNASAEALPYRMFPYSFKRVISGHDPKPSAISKWTWGAMPPVLCYAALL
jgi:hypothetical protein